MPITWQRVDHLSHQFTKKSDSVDPFQVWLPSMACATNTTQLLVGIGGQFSRKSYYRPRLQIVLYSSIPPQVVLPPSLSLSLSLSLFLQMNGQPVS